MGLVLIGLVVLSEETLLFNFYLHTRGRSHARTHQEGAFCKPGAESSSGTETVSQAP
jgi:hypothetical protein